MTEYNSFQKLLSTDAFNHDKIGIIGIPTKDRPESLARLLEGIQTSHLDGFKGSIVVNDASDIHAEACQGIVRDAQARLSCPLVYRNKVNTENMIAYLSAQTGTDIDVLRIGFLGDESHFSAGGARNEFLLLQNGKTGIQIDDDIVLKYAQIRSYDKLLRVSHEVPIAIKTFETREDINLELKSVDINPLTLYEDFFREALGQIDAFSTQQNTHPNAHILSIQNGLYGDACVQRFFSVQQRPERNERLYSGTELSYERQKHTTHVIQSAESPTITDNPLCITAYIAIRGDYLFPPFPPIGRAEDFLAGVIASHCCSGSLSAHLGTLALHERDTIIPMSEIFGVALPPSNRILASIIGKERYTGATEENIQRVGEFISSFSGMDLVLFEEYLIAESRKVWEATVGLLETRLATYTTLPDYWQKDMRAYIVELESIIATPTIELVKRVGDEVFWQSIQKGYYGYGKLLQAWPALWRASIDKSLLEY